jgi:hypothetical protein
MNYVVYEIKFELSELKRLNLRIKIQRKIDVKLQASKADRFQAQLHSKPISIESILSRIFTLARLTQFTSSKHHTARICSRRWIV